MSVDDTKINADSKMDHPLLLLVLQTPCPSKKTQARRPGVVGGHTGQKKIDRNQDGHPALLETPIVVDNVDI